jgi:hypothetical protein
MDLLDQEVRRHDPILRRRAGHHGRIVPNAHGDSAGDATEPTFDQVDERELIEASRSLMPPASRHITG